MEECLERVIRKAESLRAAIEATRRRHYMVDLRALGRRTKCISELEDLHENLRGLAAEVGAHLEASRALHGAEVATFKSALGDTAIATPWTDPRRTALIGRGPAARGGDAGGAPADRGRPPRGGTTLARRRGRATPPALAEPALPAFPPPSPRKLYTRVGVGGGVELDAVVIPTHHSDPQFILDAVSTTQLHYIPQWKHFAVRVGTTVFHAGLGDTLAPGERPVRVRDCRHGAHCPSLADVRVECNYYHNPELCPGSQDVRNYGPYDRLYAPACHESRLAMAPRRFGSGRDVPTDLTRVGRRDAQRFKDQVAHDILCALVLEKYCV